LNQPPTPEKVVVTVKKLAPFTYNDTHAVPWSYDTKVETIGSSSKCYSNCLQENEEVVNHVTGVGGIARSGRHYSPKEGEKRKIKRKL